MKVALLFFGQPRFLNNPLPYQTHKNKIIDKYDTDVFCHTWWSENESQYNISSWANVNDCQVEKNTIDIIKELYKPIELIHEPSKQFDIDENSNFYKLISQYEWALKNINNLKSHLYSINKVGEILKNHIDKGNNYDFIILSRLDANVIRFPDLNKLDKNGFYLPNHHEKFPDNIFCFGQKYLNFTDIYSKIETLCTKVWEPSAEAFKWENYKMYYNNTQIPIYDLYAEFVRNN